MKQNQKQPIKLCERHDGHITWYWTDRDDDQSELYECSRSPMIYATELAMLRVDFKVLVEALVLEKTS